MRFRSLLFLSLAPVSTCDVCTPTPDCLKSPASCGLPSDGVSMVGGQPEERVPAAHPGIDQAVRNAIEEQDLVGVAVGVAKAGQVVFVKGYGFANLTTQEPVLSSYTMFRWASVSKTATGVIGTQLAQEGALDLDAPIDDYYDGYPVPATYLSDGDELTVPAAERYETTRWLLAHLGGIMHYDNGDGSATPSGVDDPDNNTGIEWAIEELVGKPLVGIPGRQYSYSTFGFNLAGVVMEEASGDSFADLLEARVAQPAGLHSLQPDYEWADIPHRAAGYEYFGETAYDVGSSDVSWKLPGGGIISTAHDFAGYCAALMGTALLDAEGKAMAFAKQRTSGGDLVGYGLGFGVGSRGGRRLISHNGSQQKTRTSLRLYPDEGLCFVVMTNTHTGDPDGLNGAVEDAWRAAPLQ